MRKQLLIALGVLVVMPSVVYATSDENVTKRRPDRPSNPEIQEIREARQENRENYQDKMQEFRSNVAENHANRLERRFGLYYTRLSNIITRFQKRLDILKDDGKDVTSIQTKLDAAKAKLESAKTKGGEAVAAFRAIDPAKFSEQKTQAFAARDLAMAARKLFVEAHELLKTALKELKTVSKPALPAASAALN